MSLFLKDSFHIKTISAKELKLGLWAEDAALFIMPGGADIPYTKKLNGKGNQIIKNYVANGGKYLGICAGSYYGSSSIEFAAGTKMEVIGSRELGFFPGKVIGPVFGYYHRRGCGINVKIRTTASEAVDVYFNGGGYFKDAEKFAGVEVIGWYENNLPAIININNGSVILSGAHFEYNVTDNLLKDDYNRHMLIKQILTRMNL